MKICYILDFSVMKVDGPTINEYEFIQALESQKHTEVLYFTCEDNARLIGKTNSSNSIFFKNYQDRRLSNLPIACFLVFVKFLYFYFKNRPDIIVTRLGPVPLFQFMVSVFLGKRTFIKTMGRFWGTGDSSLTQKALNFLNIRIMKNVAGIDTVTDKFKNIFHERYHIPKDKITKIENSVNINSFSPEPNEKTWRGESFKHLFPILGYVGNLPSKRGATQLLDLYKKIQNKFSNMGVIVAGHDHDLGLIKKKIENEGLKNVFLFGEIPYKEVPDVIKILDIGYSFTTSHDLSEVGNSSQKLRQYLSCGKPVITMTNTNEFITKQDLGSTVDQDNIDEIAEETVKWIKRTENEGESLSKRLHQYAKEHLSTEKTFQQRLDFWNSILKD